VFVIVTVLTAGVQSVRGWWRQIPSAAPAEQLSLQILCALACLMLVLTVVIVVDAIRKWRSILGSPTPAARPAPVIETA
jgi:hypothetical protein